VSDVNFDASQDDIQHQEQEILSQQGYGKWQTQAFGKSVNQV